MSIINYVCDSIKGKLHLRNEDRIEIIELRRHLLFLLFDGASSSRNSLATIELSIQYIRDALCKASPANGLSLKTVLFETNQFVVSNGSEDSYTTYCAMLIPYDGGQPGVISSLGDSRIYRVCKDKLKQLSKDSEVFDDETHLVKCLGLSGLTEYEFEDRTLVLEGERFLICTDGFYNIAELNDETIVSILNDEKMAAIPGAIVNAIRNPPRDDMTYILLHVSAASDN